MGIKNPMKRKRKIMALIGALALCLSFNSCNDSSDKNMALISVPNDSIKGQAFIGNSTRTIDYVPKGNFIQAIKPDSGIWTNLIIKTSNKTLASKLFFSDHSDSYVSLLYDSLGKGHYELKYVSELKDTISESLNFEHNIELRFPSKINDFYKVKHIGELDVERLTKNDTLQLLFKNHGCFGSSDKLIEFITNENKNITFRKKISGLRYEDEPEDEWIYSKKGNARDPLIEFVSNIKTLSKNNKQYCSSQIEYIFRIKGTHTIYRVKDKSCKFSDQISEIINTRQLTPHL